MTGPYKNVTSLLLAAMLLGATVTPLALRHTHPPEHGHASRDHHHDGHRNPTAGHSHSEESRESSALAELGCGHWWHVHFRVLGYRVTLPDPAPSPGDRESEDNVPVLMLALDQELYPGWSSRPDSLEHRVPPPAFSMVGNAAALQVVVSAPPPVSCAPLCDIARRERSGVLSV